MKFFYYPLCMLLLLATIHETLLFFLCLQMNFLMIDIDRPTADSLNWFTGNPSWKYWINLVSWWILPKRWNKSISGWLHNCFLKWNNWSWLNAPSNFHPTGRTSCISLSLCLSQNKTANIYTGSQYAFGVTHDFVILWKQRGFLTSSGQKIKNK